MGRDLARWSLWCAAVNLVRYMLWCAAGNLVRYDHPVTNDDLPDSELPSEVDENPESAPSVLERLSEVIGSKPLVFLRDTDEAGDAPSGTPSAPGETHEAGKYSIHGEIGHGGVGVVHRGHDGDLGRDVAMKFLHEKYKDEPAILHRFVEEAQIGGQLQHPGIVPVYDLGMSNGRPFFAMKLVKGETLAKKLSQRESPASDARTFLAIFEDICQTMAYAHARGVVHRDLKPANIMIGSFGEVQVVDWGMGKVLASTGVADEQRAAERQAEVSLIETVRSGGHGTQSLVGSVMGTPPYMPPEQARGDVDAMDERSDVFSLGAILCEILTGKPPYVGDPIELISMAAMAELDGAHARLAACGGEQEMIDLATRCLMPAPAARPKSAEFVARAVHDHLAAVEARVHEARVESAEAKVRAASLKRVQKLGISLTVVIAAGLVVSLWFWRAADQAAKGEELAKTAALASADEARSSEARAVEETANTQRELTRALEIKRLITEMLTSVSPEVAKGADTKLLEGILGSASKRLLDGTIQDERIAGELHGLIGGVYRNLGFFDDAEQHLPVALELRKRALGAEHPDTLQAQHSLAALLTGQGKSAEAEALFLQTLEAQKRVLGEEHPSTLQTLSSRAGLFLYQGRHKESEQLYAETLEVMRRVLGEEHRNTLLVKTNLATLYRGQGRYAEAEPLFLETLETSERELGEEDPVTLGAMVGLTELYIEQGRADEAEPMLLRALEIMSRVLGEKHPSTLSESNNLASLYRLQGRYAEAATLLSKTLEIQEDVLGQEHLRTLGTAAALAGIYIDQGLLEEAEELYLETLEVMRPEMGEGHPETLTAMSSLAGLYSMQGRHDEAVSLYLQTLEVQERELGEGHPSTLSTMGNLGYAYQAGGRYAEAEALHLRTLGITERDFGAESPSTLTIKLALANLYADLGRLGEAEALLLPTLELMRRALGDENPDTLAAMSNLALVYRIQGRYGEAEALHLRSLEIQERVFGDEDPSTLGTLMNLMLIYKAQGRYAEAETLSLRTLEIQKSVLGDESPNTLGAMTNLGNLYLEMGRFEDAAEMFETSLPIKRRVLGLQHPWTRYAMGGLMAAYLELGRTDDALQLQRELVGLIVSAASEPEALSSTLNSAARALLETDSEELVDPEQAVGFAERACQLAEASSDPFLPSYLDTLAFAQHEAGDTAAAVATQKRALALIPEGADPGMTQRLADYEAALE